MDTVPDIAGYGEKVWPVRHIRNNEGMNELSQDNGNDTKGANEMKMLAWLSGRAIISGAHRKEIASYEYKNSTYYESVA